MSECPSSEKLSAYLDGEVSEAQASAMARHVAECAACAAVLGNLRRVGDFLRTAKFAAPSAALLRQWHRQADEFAWRGPERLAGGLAAMAACGAIVCAVFFAHSPTPTAVVRNSTTAPVPETWEREAVNPGSEDPAVRDTTLAEWMVSGLSSSGVARE